MNVQAYAPPRGATFSGVDYEMKTIDKKKFESWRPYALLTLTAGAVAAVTTVSGAASKVWSYFTEASFIGGINGYGGVLVGDNKKFYNFLSNNVGNEVGLSLFVDFSTFDEIADVPKCGEKQLVSEDLDAEHDDPLNDLRNSLNGKLFNFYKPFDGEGQLSGNSFLVTHHVSACDTMVVSVSGQKAELAYSDNHNFTLSIEGPHFVRWDGTGYPNQFILVSR